MGLLSCFPGALAYTHHCIVQQAAFNCGNRKEIFSSYALLGDDIAIWDVAVALEYEKLINQLKIKISRHKSLVAFGSAEFAKTLISRGNFITPLP